MECFVPLLISSSLHPCSGLQVMSSIWTGNPNSRYSEGCTTITLYSGMRKYGRVLSKTVGAKGKDGFWYHPFNIIVEYDGRQPGPGQDWSTCAGITSMSPIVCMPPPGPLTFPAAQTVVGVSRTRSSTRLSMGPRSSLTGVSWPTPRTGAGRPRSPPAFSTRRWRRVSANSIRMWGSRFSILSRCRLSLLRPSRSTGRRCRSGGPSKES